MILLLLILFSIILQTNNKKIAIEIDRNEICNRADQNVFNGRIVEEGNY